MPESAASLYFEDLYPGRQFDLGQMKISQSVIEAFAQLTGDVHPLHTNAAHAREAGFADQLAHGSLITSLAIGRVISAAIMNESVVAMSDLCWDFRAPIYADQNVGITMQVTDRRLKSDGSRGGVGRRFVIRDGERILQEGSSRVVVRTRDAAAALRGEDDAPSFGSVAWASQLEQRLKGDDTFRAATSSFDGTMAIAFGNTRSAVRVYRGQIIDVGRAVAANPTFTIAAPYETWIEFARRGRNEFISFAMSDAFQISGSTYDYLRFTRAIMIATDHVRALLASSHNEVHGA